MSAGEYTDGPALPATARTIQIQVTTEAAQASGGKTRLTHQTSL